ncbi:MAG: cation transporter [Clostridia bacterium]|nr:cation transporter [Clostridia bacterium]
MKKVFKLDEVDCAVCAQNMENGIKKIEGVESAVVSYVTQKLLIECDEGSLDKILDEAQKVIKKVDPRCRIIRN